MKQEKQKQETSQPELILPKLAEENVPQPTEEQKSEIDSEPVPENTSSEDSPPEPQQKKKAKKVKNNFGCGGAKCSIF